MQPSILIIDDNPDVIKALSVLFALEDMHCLGAESPQQGLAILADQPVDLVIQDMNFTDATVSGKEGIELFRTIRDQHIDLPIILLTAWANLETAVQLVKAGAADYLAKPWDDDKLVLTVKNLLELHQLQSQQHQAVRQRKKRQHTLIAKYDMCGMAFESDAMLSLLEMATQVAHADVPVLITGPNGAGKEKIAEVVQANSARKDAPFIKVNVGALPETLMEAEMFGAEPGAYTGNTKRRIGRFEAADGGTLFLDEIGNLSAQGQQRLLRVLETGQFERLGSTTSIQVDVRVISATNANLTEAIARGEFREDLFYRLNLIELQLAPLNERRADILPLAQHFLVEPYRLQDDAERLICQYHWPGNVRELQNCIKRAMLLSPEADIPASTLGIQLQRSESYRQAEELTKADIEQALATHQNVIAKAAKHLGISRQALYRRMEKFRIEPKAT